MFKDRSVTVVIPAYNEEQTIADVVGEFRHEPSVDHIVVVDNNCKDGTAEKARGAGAEVIAESAPGYGCAIRAAVHAGDIHPARYDSHLRILAEG